MRRRTSLLSVALALVVSSALAQGNPVPFVNQPLVPTSISPGHSAFTLTVNGTGFNPAATVNWNGQPRTTTFVSSGQLQATIAAADLAHATTAAITVVNPPPAGPSNIVYFSVGPTSSSVGFNRIDTPLNLSPAGAVMAYAVGDFNNDGKLDLVVATGSVTIEVFLGNGDGTFQSPISTVFNIQIPFCYDVGSLTVGNFSGSGNLDLAMGFGCDPYTTVVTALGTGSGAFTLGPKGYIIGEPTATGDFNADGYLDLITANEGFTSSDWSVLSVEGRGAGAFVNRGILEAINPYALTIPAVGDFNHDGALDVAVPVWNQDYSTPDVYVLLGEGDGAFRDSSIYHAKSLAERNDNGLSVAAGDLNGDGNLDLVAGDLTIFLGNGDGAFTISQSVSFWEGLYIQLADFNNDGKLDVLLASSSAPYQCGATLFLGNGDGTLQYPQTFATPYTNLAPIYVGDFNGDGKLDFLQFGWNATTQLPVASIFLQSN